jgi:hypothetical protein
MPNKANDRLQEHLSYNLVKNQICLENIKRIIDDLND